MIDHNVILTSAQLFEGLGYNMYDFDLHYWRLFAGEYNVLTTDPHEKVYTIKSVFIHPGYNYTTLENDIALVITTQPIAWNNHTRPACLPDNSKRASVGSVCYLPGFGGMGGIQMTGTEEVMNQVDLTIVDDSVCANRYKGYMPNNKLCAGYENQHKNFCWDDLGGPLMFKANSGVWVIQGLASSGGNCTLANQPSVFEDVSMNTK
ncbi:plasma kallikrein-like isoform X2 [Dreissena polymorpha]|uniref:plasma kallikrein-like isoform X2 n=1 Tax=Dreissena polymorpha TaxID=45954 RepID=UPI0022649749|nr:plasma kallikrein-like isoform X2 [Dreissena polymorpha]